MTATNDLGARMELMKRMGAAVDADIFKALSDGRIGGLELHDMVLRCAECRHSEECGQWLDKAETAETAAPGVAPGYCLNRMALWELSQTKP